MEKRVLLIWDLDGAVGQINASMPYNFHFAQFERELNNVMHALDIMTDSGIRSTFAITGFSAEEGLYPYTFPELIREIAGRGHEVASHSWRHEWLPLFSREQGRRSLMRSRTALERLTGDKVYGFVPPHNRPMTWWGRGALSLGDRGWFPFFPLADNGSVIRLCQDTGYSWIRISYKPIWKKASDLTGKIWYHKSFMILENHYVGFDDRVIRHIIASKKQYHIVSAHPLMLDFTDKSESMTCFKDFIKKLLIVPGLKFVTPRDIQALNN